MKAKNPGTIKVIIFILITVFIFMGPAYRQVFGGKNKIFRNWVMWSGKGIGLYDLRLYEIDENGNAKFINYKNELKVKGNSSKNRRLRRLRRKADVKEVAKLICKKLPKSHIQMNLRLARKDGWETVYSKNTNICSNPKSLRF